MSFKQIIRSAEERSRLKQESRARVVVQLGHCTRAVGADDALAVLRKKMDLRDDAYLVVAGCDGACHLAPQVTVSPIRSERRRYTHVSSGEKAAAAIEGLDVLFVDEMSAANEEFFTGQSRRILQRCGSIDSESIDEYLLWNGYEGLAAALTSGPEEVIDMVAASDLRGRGGAYFPVAIKWRGASAVPRTPRYLVVNAEEGEPGLFKDRHLMEGDPHSLLEGMLIAGYAMGSEHGIIYVNAEADLAANRLAIAIEEAQELGLVGSNIMGTNFSFTVEIRRGAGGYVCGEETTLLNTIEGKRRVPRLRPPFPVEVGVFGQPTVINNVETLCNVPFILRAGADAFRSIGLEDAPGTKLICLSGAVRRTGLVEIPMGTTVKEIIFDLGGGPKDGDQVMAVGMGGPSGGLLPAHSLDVPIGPGVMMNPGIVLGSGGVVAIDGQLPIHEVVRRLAAYNANESCGKCTPCREGTPRIVESLDRLRMGSGTSKDLEELWELSQILATASLCGLGQMAGNPITSALSYFGTEFVELTSGEGQRLS